MSMPLYRRQERNAQLMDFKCVEFVEELMYRPVAQTATGPLKLTIDDGRLTDRTILNQFVNRPSSIVRFTREGKSCDVDGSS